MSPLGMSVLLCGRCSVLYVRTQKPLPYPSPSLYPAPAEHMYRRSAVPCGQTAMAAAQLSVARPGRPGRPAVLFPGSGNGR